MKNIVHITFDSLRTKQCGFMGYERDTTPYLDQLAAEGTVFDDAVSPAARTNVSMSSSLSGTPILFRERISDPSNSNEHLEIHGTAAEDFKEAGYATGAFCPNAYASSYYGFDRGFDIFEDFLFTDDVYQRVFEKHLGESEIFTTIRNLRNFVQREEAFRTWESYVDDAVKWCKRQKKPFYLWIFSMDTHFPYLTPREYRRWSSLVDQYYYNWKRNKLIGDFDPDLSEKAEQKLINIYDDSILFADALIANLKERLDDFDPIYVVHGDHGEAFGEGGVYGHFHPDLIDANVHVPLVVSGDDIPDQTISEPFSLLGLRSLLSDIRNDNLLSPSQNYATMSTYDGVRERNLYAVSIGEYKLTIEISEDGELARLYRRSNDPSSEELVPNAEESEVYEALRDLVTLQQQTEDERLLIDQIITENGLVIES